MQVKDLLKNQQKNNMGNYKHSVSNWTKHVYLCCK